MKPRILTTSIGSIVTSDVPRRSVLQVARNVLVATCLVVVPAVAVAGQESDQDQDERPAVAERVVVTADRLPAGLTDVGSSVTVIGRELMEATGAHWLMDVLESVPGVTVARSGGPGTVTSVFLRGTSSNHTLFLINGVKVNSPATGAYDLAHLPVERIERIEIVRGPQSTLYGSEALGGVINVITRSGDEGVGAGVVAEGGSYSTGRAQAWVEGGNDRVSWSAGASLSDTDGISAAAEERGNVEDDAYRNVSMDGRVTWRGGGGWSVDGFIRGFDASLDNDGFAFGQGPADDLNSMSEIREFYSGVGFHYDAERWSQSLTISASELDLETEDPDAFTRTFALDGAIRELDWQVDVGLASGNRLMGGVEYRRESATSESETTVGASGFDEGVDVLGIWLQDRLEPTAGVHLTVGGRLEDHSTFGTHGTFRVTSTAEVGDRARIHGSVGSGFRAPSLNDLFFPGFSNPDLEPEESIGVDLGVALAAVGSDVWVDVTGFWNDIDQLVSFVSGGPVNLGQVRTQGVEVAARVRPAERVTLEGSYTFTDAEDRDTGLQLVRRPRHQGSVQLVLRPVERLRLFTEVRAKGRRFDQGAVDRVELEGFAVWSAAAQLELTRELALRVRAENLLDRRYQEVFGYGTPGASGYVGLQFSPGDDP